MGEGLLKKRIRKMKFLPSGDQTEGEEMVDANSYEEVLDEAKKDFPKFEEIHGFVFSTNDPIQETIMRALEKANEQIEWFLKWFGESEK